MKKLIALWLAALMLLGMAACGGAAAPEATEPSAEISATNPPTTLKSLKVLAIGNSFSVDAMEHLYTIAKAEGVEEIVLGNLYIGGCSLETHATNAASDKAAYKYYKNTTGEWVLAPMEATLLKGLQDEDWDIITMQQNSGNSGLTDTYDPFLTDLVNYVNENKTNPDAKLYWHMTWAYQSDSTHAAFDRYGSNQNAMYLGIVNCLQKVVQTSGYFEKILPAGTAVQNARTSFLGDTLTRDGFHLSNLGRVIAAYTWYAAIDGQPLYAVNIDKAATHKLSDSEKKVIVEAVNAAIANPYAVTASEIKTR